MDHFTIHDTTMDANSNEEDEQVTEEVSDRDDVEYSGYGQNINDCRERSLYTKDGKSPMTMMGQKNLRIP